MISISMCHSVNPSVFLFSPWSCLPACRSVYSSVRLYVSVSPFLFLSLFIDQSVSLTVYLHPSAIIFLILFSFWFHSFVMLSLVMESKFICLLLVFAVTLATVTAAYDDDDDNLFMDLEEMMEKRGKKKPNKKLRLECKYKISVFACGMKVRTRESRGTRGPRSDIYPTSRMVHDRVNGVFTICLLNFITRTMFLVIVDITR